MLYKACRNAKLLKAGYAREMTKVFTYSLDMEMEKERPGGGGSIFVVHLVSQLDYIKPCGLKNSLP